MTSRAPLAVATRAALCAVAIAPCASACRPDLGPPDSLLTRTQLLAVKAEPPEARPGDTVVYRALVASPQGTATDAPLVWSFCAAPKPHSENEVVSQACHGDLAPFGGPGAIAAGVTPSDACANFGPDVPPGGYRPRDPDVTGGYYQPLRATMSGVEAFALERVRCNLANTSADNARTYAQQYRANANPQLAPLTATIDGAPIALDRVPAGARVTLRAAWRDGDAETYVALDPASQTIQPRREAMRVSWYATAGAFASDRTGRDEADPATTSDDAWTAPSSPGVVHVWLVLRDSRGGSDFQSDDLTVVP